jgi:hypothetical protein
MLLVLSASSAFAQSPGNSQLQEMAQQQLQRADAIEQEINRFASQHLPSLPEDRQAVAEKLIDAKTREIQALRSMATAFQQNNQQGVAAARNAQASAFNDGQVHFQHMQLLATRDRMSSEVQQLESERTLVPAGLNELFDTMVSSRRAAAGKYGEAAAAFGDQPHSVDSINAIGRAKGAEMESGFKRKEYLLNQQIVQFRQLAQ